MQPLHKVLKQRIPIIWVTQSLIAVNVLVFLAMLFDGAGFWHSPNGVQLAWGANFGPATQDGEWWRLGSAMFLHFGLLHLVFNIWALWDAGQLVERMYGHLHFISIYLISGLMGNLVSLVMQGNLAVSGGASGAIFGIYGALLTFLWYERAAIDSHEFRWLFGGAAVFAIATIVLGFTIPGIDNSAHIGGFVTGLLISQVLTKPLKTTRFRIKTAFSICTMAVATVILVINIPPPKYRWSDELLLRKEIGDFLIKDQAINRSWLEIMNQGQQGNTTYDALAYQINSTISDPYDESFEKLSQLPSNTALPSATNLAHLLTYVQHRKDESKMIAEKLRNQKILGIRSVD
ncbi:MAG TPA: rhomboid family intramembrane serine protease [Methylotenera sp.]|nr:rhomboid family intramembrane serine protease [Methylotenera sp.]